MARIKMTPWPKNGIEFYSSAKEGEWGYLYEFADGRPIRFDDSIKPSVPEIEARWGIYFLQSGGRK